MTKFLLLFLLSTVIVNAITSDPESEPDSDDYVDSDNELDVSRHITEDSYLYDIKAIHCPRECKNFFKSANDLVFEWTSNFDNKRKHGMSYKYSVIKGTCNQLERSDYKACEKCVVRKDPPALFGISMKQHFQTIKRECAVLAREKVLEIALDEVKGKGLPACPVMSDAAILLAQTYHHIQEELGGKLLQVRQRHRVCADDYVDNLDAYKHEMIKSAKKRERRIRKGRTDRSKIKPEQNMISTPFEETIQEAIDSSDKIPRANDLMERLALDPDYQEPGYEQPEPEDTSMIECFFQIFFQKTHIEKMSPLVSKLKDKIKRYPLSTLHISCTIGLSLINTLLPIHTLPFTSPFLANPSLLLYALFPFTQTILKLEQNTKTQLQSIPGAYPKSSFPTLYSILFSATILDRLFLSGSSNGFSLFDTSLKFISAFMFDDAIVIGGMRVHPLLFASIYATLNGCLIKSFGISVGVCVLMDLGRSGGGSCKTYLINVASSMSAWFVDIWMSIGNDEIGSHSWTDVLVEPLFVLFPLFH